MDERPSGKSYFRNRLGSKVTGVLDTAWDCGTLPSRTMKPVSILSALIFPAIALADDGAFFRDKVRPILADHCFKCHSHEASKSKGGLVLDSREALLAGGDTGAAMVPGKPEESLIIKAISYADKDLQMPPNKGESKKLGEAQIATLTEWVKMGAPWPGEAKGQKMTARGKGGITDEDRKWWAIQPVAKVEPPKGAKHPVDAFLLAKMDGVSPAKPAAPEQLVRRIYMDLVGLPPSLSESDAFAKAARENSGVAVAELVDTLLASPQYGERWARYWLDLVRYAESDGYKLDEFRPAAWRYRDYVVQSLNADMPYDRFVQEQLAADELWPGDPRALAATGFLRAGIYEYNNRDVAGQRDSIMNEVTDVTGDVFMGLGVQCARCHDHKFDPILQRDYFRLRSFFEPMLWRDDVPAATAQERAAHAQSMKVWEEKTAAVRAKMEPLEAKAREVGRKKAVTAFPPETQAILAKPLDALTPEERPLYDLAFRQVQYEWDHLLNHLKGAEKDQLIKLQKELSAFDAAKPAPLPELLSVSDVGPVAPATRIPKKDGDIAPGFLTILSPDAATIPTLAQSTGRRAALAKWLTDPANPLTARVIVNRVWQSHFGRGLVVNASDFGKLTEPPIHGELLDWLTRSFVENGWSLKKLHRVMMTSAAYAQSSGGDTTRDPENKFHARQPGRRLDAEQVRDAVLATTGELDRQSGGASVGWDKPRRTIYTKVLRNNRDSLLEVFDVPEGFQSTALRNSTTTSTQALTLFNGPWTLARAKALAARVTRESSADDGERAFAAMRLAWGREPSRAEVDAARTFLQKETRIIEARPPEMKPLALTTDKMPFREGRGVVLSPSGVDRLFMRASPEFPAGDFTLEAFVVLRSLYENAEVRTIASHWSGDKKQPGWAFGITGRQSRYKPQTLVLLLNGEGSPEKEAEPIFSGMNLEIGKPYYVAVTVKIAQLADGVTFYSKDLSNDDLPLQVAAIPHLTRGGIRSPGDFTLGARGTQKSSVWDGIIDDVRLSRAALPAESLLLNSAQPVSDATIGYWKFENSSGLYKDSSPRGHDIQATIVQSKPADPAAAAFIDFCHVLLNSNEFLYLD